MKYKNMAMILPLSLVSVGCSTDDIADLISDDNSKDTVQIEINGKVIDGYISDAKVYIDLNNNKRFDSGEPQTTSDEKGNYSFDTEIEVGEYRIIAEGGFDTTSQKNFEGTLTTFVDTENIDGNLIITPVSTLVAEKYFKDTSKSFNNVKNEVVKSLNLKVNVDIMTTDFMADKNQELFLANQNILKNIDTLSSIAKNDNGDMSSARFDAIDTIGKTGSLNVNENLNKMGYQQTSQIANDKSSVDSTMEDAQNAFDELDEETAKIDGDFDFDTWAKDIQDKRIDEVANIRGKVESFEKIPPNLPLDRESILPKHQIALTFDEFKAKNGTLTEEEFKTEIESYLKLNKDSDNFDLDFKNSFQDVESGIEVFEKSFEELTLDNIELDSTSSLPKTVTLADGNEITFTLVSEKGGVAIIEFENKNESYKFSGDFSIEVNKEGQIIQSMKDIEMSSTFFDGTIESMDGARFDGSFSSNNTDLNWKGDFKNDSKEVSLNGYFNIHFKNKKRPQYMETYQNEVFTETDTMDIKRKSKAADFPTIPVSSTTNYQEYKADRNDGYQQYIENQANEFEKYKANEKGEYINHTLADSNESNRIAILDKETAEKYMLENNITYPTKMDKPAYEPIKLYDDVFVADIQVMDSISMEIKFVSKDTKISFKAKGDQEYLSVENFSFEKSDEVTIKFNKAEILGYEILSGLMMNFGESEDMTSVNELPVLDDEIIMYINEKNTSEVDNIDEIVENVIQDIAKVETVETETNSTNETIKTTEKVENQNSTLPPSVPSIKKETKTLKSQDKMARDVMNISISGLFIDINKDGIVFSAKGDLSTNGHSSKMDFTVINYNDEISNLRISAIEELDISYVQITSEDNYVVIIKKVGDKTEIVDMDGNRDTLMSSKN